jgi:hypothetical protein
MVFIYRSFRIKYYLPLGSVKFTKLALFTCCEKVEKCNRIITVFSTEKLTIQTEFLPEILAFISK